MKVNSRRLILVLLFWLGLGLCASALIKYWGESQSLLENIGLAGAAVASILLSASWWLAMESWRLIVKAYSGQGLSRRNASRHLSLLLLGKYIPGGIWGFAARLADSSSSRSMPVMVASGLFEQWCGFASVTILSAVVLGAVFYEVPIALAGCAFVSAAVIIGWELVRRVLGWVGNHTPTRWRNFGSEAICATPTHLWGIASVVELQQILQFFAVAYLAHKAFSLDMATAGAVAACYGLAIAIGLAAIVAPGGMLVREAAFVAISSNWLPYPQAIAFAAVMRLVFTCFDFMAGFAAIGMQLIFQRSRPQ